MHAPLGVPERQLICSELIAALEECHARGMIARWTGVCNEQKRALNACLRQERVDRTARNRTEAKDRTAKKQALWADMDREMAEIKAVEAQRRGSSTSSSSSGSTGSPS